MTSTTQHQLRNNNLTQNKVTTSTEAKNDRTSDDVKLLVCYASISCYCVVVIIRKKQTKSTVVG